MPVYEVTGPAGLTLELEGDAPPSESELDSIFAEASQRTAPQQKSTLQELKEAPGDFVSSLGRAGRLIRGGGQDVFNYLVGAAGRTPEQEQQARADFGENFMAAAGYIPPSATDEELANIHKDRQGVPMPPLPIEETIRQMPTVPRLAATAGAGLVEAAPKFAAMAVGAEALGPLAGLHATLPASLAGGATFGFDEAGKFQPKQAALMAALPFIGKYSGIIAETLASKAGVTKDIALNAVNRISAVGGAAAPVIAQGELEIRKLPVEQQHDARINLYANVAQFALGLMGSERANLPSKRTIELNNSTRLTEPLPKTKEVPSAVQERSATEIPVGETPGRGPEVGGQVRQPETLAETQSQAPQEAQQPVRVEPEAPKEGRPASQKADPNSYTPAVRSGEGASPIVGEQGQIHQDIHAAQGDEVAASMSRVENQDHGFVGPDGKWVSKEELGKRLDAKGPVDSQKLRDLQNATKPTVPATPAAETPGSVQKVGEVAADIGKVVGKAKGPGVLTALDSAADRARARLEQRRKSTTYGSGPFHELPTIADWAIIGASKLARGGYDVAKWSVEMVRELGDQIKPFLDQVYRHSAAMAGRMQASLAKEREGIGAVLGEGVDMRREEQAAYGAAVMQKIIKDTGSFEPKTWSDAMLQKFGDDVHSPNVLEELFKSARDEMSEGVPIPEPAGRKPFPARGGGSVTMSERAALANSLRERQAASASGRKAGEVSKAEELAPVIDDLRQKLSDSVSKIQALGQYFAGQERGAKVGAEQARADAEMADRWLEADSNRIRESLLDVSRGLPVSERGRFTSAITSAMRRPKLFAGSVQVGGKMNPQTISAVENMYRKAAQVAARIENRIAEVKRANVVTAIRDFSRWTDSPKIDVPYRQRIKSELAKFNRLEKGVGLSDDALQAAHDRLTSLRDIGRTEQGTKEALWQWQKDFAETRLQSQPTRPVETRPELRPQPGEKTPLSMRLRNWLSSAQNRAAVVDKALLPIDALFDLMESAKGTYDGWLFRHARGPVDLAYNEATVRRNDTLAPFDAYVKEHRLTAQNAERIGVFAQNMQEGGRQRLIDAGLTPEAIDRIVKSLGPVEKRAYGIMREIMDAQLPEIQETMRKLYNTEVKPERNYFPMPRDWRVFEDVPADAKAPGTEAAYDELATWKALREDLTPRATHSTRKGFTLEREEGAKTPIRIDAFDIFRQHINDTSYLIEMQPTLKQMGELARGDLFREKYGNVGQKIILDWLDTVARQGGVENFKRWKLLDTLRKNTSVGIIGFRLASQVVHESNVPYVVARIGPKWFGTGMRETLTDHGQAFLDRNFAESRQRAGGEPAQAESEKEGVRIAGVQVVSPKVTRASYAIARQLDRFNSQASVLGTYLKILKDKGADWQNYDSLPVDREAQRMALIVARRSIASPIAKDVPQALSRGTLTGGNVSLGRSAFQFQNIFLDQWSNIRHDLWQAGIREKNPRLAATMTLAIIGAIALETGIKESSKALIGKVTGYEGRKIENEFAKKAITETVRRFPFGGQIENELQYGETGIPIIDATLLDIPKAIRQKNVIRTVGSFGQVAGVPGSSQASELAEKFYKAK